MSDAMPGDDVSENEQIASEIRTDRARRADEVGRCENCESHPVEYDVTLADWEPADGDTIRADVCESCLDSFVSGKRFGNTDGEITVHSARSTDARNTWTDMWESNDLLEIDD